MLHEELCYLKSLIDRKDGLAEIFEMCGREEFVSNWVGDDVKEHLIFAEMVMDHLNDPEWVREILEMAEKRSKTVAETIAVAEFYAKKLNDKEKAYVLYGMATGMSDNSAKDLCDTAFSILLHLHDRDSVSMLYDAGVNAFDEIDGLIVLRDNIRKFHPDPDLLRKVNEKIEEAELKDLPKFRTSVKGYDKNEVNAYLKNIGKNLL